MSNEQEKIESILYEALGKTDVEERKAYLEKACDTDTKLRAEIDSLLSAYEDEKGILKAPPDLLKEPINTLTEGPGTIIDRYKLLEKIGEGGMAVVYMAEQQEPISRKVALKIIKLGMDTKHVIARFEAERQALALMDHLNIAKVLDAGVTETGRPYFVMDLVKGVSITEYCDQNNLSTKVRLELFIQVCNAIQHAHTKGIIHRDIKPSNIMVTMHNGKANVKVIDFGIAKAINQRLTEKTLFTRYAHIIGTPAYMSPEQAQMSDIDIDIRTDIYSLGVLLYELLTGATPFSEEELRKVGYLEMQRVILEQEPPKPSTKLTSLGETLTDVAKHRGSTPVLLKKAVRGDLDWIVMKSLEKDRVRRYEAAEGLSMDIQRYLENRPVMAHAPSTGYRLHKFMCRNRVQIVVALAAVVMVGTIVVISIWNRYQIRLAEAEGARQVNAITDARKLIAKRDFKAARKLIRPILKSEHVGLEARNLFAGIMVDGHDPDGAVKEIEILMEKHYLNKVQYYTERIAANAEDANNYLQRALQYHYLHEERKVNADMDRYTTIATKGIFNVFRFGTLHFHSGIDAPLTKTDSIFGKPVNLKTAIPVIEPAYENIDCFSYDGLEVYIESNRPGGYGNFDLWRLKRGSIDGDWGPPENLGPYVNTSKKEVTANISSDGLALYFCSNRPGGYESFDIWMALRSNKDDPWRPPVNLGPNINGFNEEVVPWESMDGLELYFVSSRAGGYGFSDIYVSRRQKINDPWGKAVNLGAVVNSAYEESCLFLSPNGLLLLFSDNFQNGTPPRPGGYGGSDMWLTRRTSLSAPWEAPINLGPQVNSSTNEIAPRISLDGSTLYFSTNTSGIWDNWQAPIIPVIDLNSDDKVNKKKVSGIADHLEQNKLLFDISSSPIHDRAIQP